MSGVGSKGIPLSKEEVMILLHLIESSPTVTNKLTNSATNRLKEEAWKKITEAFNSMIKSCPRRPDQLKLKWENLKKSARKVIKLRLSRNRIGSSEPVYIPHFKAIIKIADILGISLNYSSNHDTIVFDDEGSHTLPYSNGLDSVIFGDSGDSSLPSGDIGDSSLSSVKNGDSSSTAGKNGNVCVSCGESRNARKPSKHEDGIITLTENDVNSMEFDKNKDSGTQPIKSGVVSLNKSNSKIASVPSINDGKVSLASDKSGNDSVLHGKDWAVSILPVKSGDVSMPPMKTAGSSITPNNTIPSIKSVDVSIPPTKSGNVSIPPLKDSIAPIQSGDVSRLTINSGNVSVSRKEDRDISGLCMKCGDNIAKSEKTETDLEDGNVSLSCEDMDLQNEEIKDYCGSVKSWGNLMACEDEGDVTGQFEEDDNESSGDESVIAEDQKQDVHGIKKNTSRTPTYGYHDALADYYRAKTRKVHLETMVLKAKLRLEVEKLKYEKRKLELEVLQLKKK